MTGEELLARLAVARAGLSYAEATANLAAWGAKWRPAAEFIEQYAAAHRPSRPVRVLRAVRSVWYDATAFARLPPGAPAPRS